jgi:pyrimidine operon attenuation protein/uracil phosphoribosyltransferase
MKAESIKNSVEVAKKIEKRYGVAVSVVAETPSSPMPWTTGPSGTTIYIISPRDDELTLLKKIRADPEIRLSTEIIQQVYPVNESVEATKKDKTLLRRGLGASGFIVPFLFQNEVYGTYSKEFKTEFRRNFGPELDKEIQERFARLGMKNAHEIGQRARELKALLASEKKVFGRFEQQELSKALIEMAQKAHEQEINLIIVLDRAGRYIGTPLKRTIREVYGKSIPVFFMDPTALIPERYVIEAMNREAAKTLLSAQHKTLAQALPGSRVMIIDDKVYEGRTKMAVLNFIKLFKPQHYTFTVQSMYRGKDFSWRQQQLYNIETDSKRLVTHRINVNPQQAKQIAGLRKGIKIVTNKVIHKLKTKRR